MTERDKFEAWAKGQQPGTLDLTPFEDTYDSDFTSRAWDAWQARALLAADASEDARDAARWRHLRNCGVIVDFTHAGPWKFTDDVDAAVDKLMARSAAINAARGSKTTERKKLCKGSHIMCEGREYCLAYPSCSELEAKESGND